jgi:DNA-binding SARP family transcriptional activator/class 3 adenylate cyclase
VQIAVLGPLQVSGDGVRTPTAPKERAVLAFLALRAGRPVRTGDLVDALWADAAPPAAVKSVQAYVARVRRAIGRDVVAAIGDGYRLTIDPDDIDLVRFERAVEAATSWRAEGGPRDAVAVLDEALGMWRSEPLSDLPDSLVARGEAVRLGELRASALEARVDARLALGEYHWSVAECERLVAESPLRERRWALLMAALYGAGRQADALRTFQRARTTLVDELGLEPGVALRQLEARILSDDPGPLLPPTLLREVDDPKGAVVWRERYELEIRRASARVARGYDRARGIRVALRVSEDMGGPDDDGRDRVRALMAVRAHRGIELPCDEFEVGDDHVTVWRWVDGIDLGSLVESTGDPGLAPPTVIGYLEQLAEALDHVHGHGAGVAHGGVAPANVLLRPDGRVVLVGAPFVERRSSRGFVAPEVAAGGPPTSASDVFGLAGTASFLLSGTMPTAAGPELGGVDPKLAKAIERGVRRAFAVDPLDRDPSAGALVERLRRALSANLPTGVLTFCLTDIVDSTALWDAHPVGMERAVGRHEDIIESAIGEHHGWFLRSQGEGDSTLSVFERATDAVSAAVALQVALQRERWPDGLTLATRVGLHSGQAQLRDGNYFGGTVNRGARLRGVAGGHQIVCSRTTRDLVADLLIDGTELVELGPRQLRGLRRTESVYQIVHPDLDTPRLDAPALDATATGTATDGPSLALDGLSASMRGDGLPLGGRDSAALGPHAGPFAATAGLGSVGADPAGSPSTQLEALARSRIVVKAPTSRAPLAPLSGQLDLAFRILGPLEVEGPGGPISVAGSRRRALLIRLLLTPGVAVQSAQLIEMVWDGSAPPGAASTLQSHVSLLRRVIGPGRLVSRDGGYALDVMPGQVDAARFEAEVGEAQLDLDAGRLDTAESLLASSLSRWRGPALIDVSGATWAVGEATRLEELRASAIELRFDALLALRRHTEVVGAAEAAIGDHPYRERLWAQLMLALYRSGRQRDALHTYQRLRHLLLDELGIVPAVELSDLEQAILAQHPALDLQPEIDPVLVARVPGIRPEDHQPPSPPPSPAGAPVVPAERRPTTVAPPGRAAQLARLLAVCGDVLPNQPGQVVVVEGELGVGVTTLLRAFEHEQRAEDESSTAAIMGSTAPRRLRDWLGSAREPASDDEAAEHDRAIATLAERAAGGGLVLILDDAQTLDDWSLEWLARVTRHPPPGVVLVLGSPTLTTIEADVGIRLAELASAPAATEVHLDRLDEPALRELVARRWPSLDSAGTWRWASHLRSWGGGHPLLVNNILSAAGPDDDPATVTLPASVEVLTTRRLDGLPSECRTVLAVAAELGPELDLALVAMVLGDTPEHVAAVLSSAIRDGLIRRSEGGPWEFDHGLVRDAVRRGVDPSDALRWHAAAGEHLRDRGGHHAEVARHLAAAVPLIDADQARAANSDAGQRLLVAGAYREAADRFREAVSLSDAPAERGDALIGLGRALESAGERVASEATFDEATRLALAAGSPSLLARAALGGTAHSSAVRGRSGRRWRLQQAWARLPNDEPDRPEVVAELALELLNAGHAWPPALADEVHAVAGDARSPARVLAARVVVAQQEARDGAPASKAAELVELALASDVPEHWAAAALAVGIGVTLATGDWDTTARWIDELAGFGARTGEPRARWQSLVYRAVLAEGRGDSRAADAAAREALSVGDRLEMADATATYALHHLGRAFRDGSLGELAPALVNVDERYRVSAWDALRAAALLDAGDVDEAGHHLERALHEVAMEDHRLDHYRVAAQAVACQVAHRLGQVEAALSLADALAARGGRFVVLGYGGPCLGPVDWYVAEALAAAGRDSEAEARRDVARHLCRRASAAAWSAVIDAR